jgi:hypothetical protein
VRRKVLIFGLISALLALGIYAAPKYIEIYSANVWEGPSPEARMNAYFALERWLEKTGHPVEVMTKKSDASVFDRRKVFCVQASGLDWTEDANAKIFSWIRDGGFLFLHWDKDPSENRGLRNFLQELGVGVWPASGTQASGRESSKAFPDFNTGFILKPVKENPNRPRMLCRKDSMGVIRLISVSLGKGAIALGASPRFMHSRSLEKEVNARLAWELTGARDSAGEGIVFIRGRNVKDGMYEAFSAKGSLAFLIISGLLLVVTGFWMVIPVFGQPGKDPEKPGRPLRERFLAEGSFLKKFGALDSYLDIYRKEIWFKSRLGSDAAPETLAVRLAPLCGMDEKTIREALTPRRGVKFREFIKQRKILKTLWESL